MAYTKEEKAAYDKIYRQTPKGKEAHSKGNAKYRKTNKRRACLKRYNTSKKGKASAKRNNNKQGLRTKKQFLDYYSLPNKCNIPGCTDTHRLEADHIIPFALGPHRAGPRNGYSLYRYIIAGSYWGDFQVLCKKHNLAKRKEDKKKYKGVIQTDWFYV